MNADLELVDIHSHYLPGIDDGAKSWGDALEMARMAVADGITRVIVTPHQLGTYAHNRGDDIRLRTAQLQALLQEHGIPLQVRAGADVRIDAEMIAGLQSGDVLTLADQQRHVLLELPHELYFPIDDVLLQLNRVGLVGILSHPERNQGLLKQPKLVESLVDRGCLMQVTAGSLLGTFGPSSKSMAEWMLEQDLTHFLASDGHSPTARRPLMRRAFDRAGELIGVEQAVRLCRVHPAAVFAGEEVVLQPRRTARGGWAKWVSWRRAA